MTAGHKHWVVQVRSPRLLAALRRPLYRTDDLAKVDASPYPYGVGLHVTEGEVREHYYLSLLSILHRWTGLAVVRGD